MSRSNALSRAVLLMACIAPAAHATLVNRWSFNNPVGTAPSGTTMTDSISGATATVYGQYNNDPATFDGAALRIPGNSSGNHSLGFMSAYINLPNGIVSSKTNFSVEIWATPFSVTNYDRLFSFGRTNITHGPGAAPGEIIDVSGQGQTPGATNGVEYLYYTFAVGNDGNTQRLDATVTGSATGGNFDSANPTTMGTRYHYVLTFEDGVGTYGTAGGQVKWYRNGALIHSRDVDFHLSQLQDVNNWLGRSQWTNDWNSDASYDEVRIYDHALTTAEIANNIAAGPDSFTDPDTDDDGLLDAWEDQYFGNNDGTATPAELALQDASGDPDNDGFTNLQEQTLGTNPNDNTSPPPAPTPDHLWTFTAQADSTAESGLVFTDEIGGAWTATLLGNGGQLDGSQVILPGSTTGNQTAGSISAYLDLSNGILSASPNITIEAWATPLSSKNWQRLFDFGRLVGTYGTGAEPGELLDSASVPGATDPWDNLSLTLNNGTNINSQQLEGEYDNTGMVPSFSSAITNLGTEYHYILMVQDGAGTYGSSGCLVSWYRNGVLQNSASYNFHLTDMEDVNNWIGRSMYSGDSNSNLALNELRIYRRTLTTDEIFGSYAAGPDPSTGPPEPPTPAPVPVRLWDFNTAAGSAPAGTTFSDIGTGEIATVRGNNAVLTGTELLIGSNGAGAAATTNGQQSAASISSYLDLPNGFVSSFTNLTFEAWITPRSSQNWQRVWDFGNCSVTSGTGALEGEIVDGATAPAAFSASDNIFLSLNNGGTFGYHRLGGKINAGTETQSNTDISSITAAGTEYHFVMTVADGAGASGASGCLVKWYRDGVFYGSIDLAFRLADMQDVNNWIGRSNWSADMNSHMSINELRVYDRAITFQEVNASFAAGPDAAFAPPTVVDDTATLHSGQKVLIDVLANDTGGANPSTVSIATPPSHGTATVQPDGKILYANDGSSTAPDSFTYTVANIGGTSSPATVDITITATLRIENSAWAMPAEPPATAWELQDALPGLTFTRPVVIATVPGDTKQLYVCEQNGAIYRVADTSAVAPVSNLFLDVAALGTGLDVGPLLAGYPENGLLGLAFHPDYANNGYFYVAYTVNTGGSYFQRISRFTRSASDPTVADTTSELVLLHISDFGLNHNGGDLHFGPTDGYLYYGTGDGENSSNGQAHSQLINGSFYSGIFRIDVDKKPGNLEPNPHTSIPTYSGLAAFSVPIDNPFVHTSLGGDWNGIYNGTDYSGSLSTIRTEFWVTGIRHAWRMSFDSLTGNLWEGDVGQVTYEEINLIQRGKNYGWAWREGAHDYSGNVTYAKPTGWTSTDPFYEYVHTAIAGGDATFKGNSVVGGWVYRGTRYPEIYGAYIFCDSVSGHIWQMDTSSGSVSRIAGLPGAYGVFSSMGVDPNNKDILFCAYLQGKIMRLTKGSDLSTGFPQTLSQTGLFADLTDLSPAPGILPIFPNLRFWSDFADKTRWFGIPDATSKMTWQKEGEWTYPEGMVWVKHFDLALTRGNPSTNKRIETRVLVKTSSGAYGVSYRWNEAGTEAYLVEDAGQEFDLTIDDGGTPHTQHWAIPGRTSCLTCHQGDPLAFTTRQLNRSETLNGFTGNQIDLLADGGYLANTPDPIDTLGFHVRPDETQYPLEQRARSYLDVNCAYCHSATGSVSGFWDGREALALAQTGMIHGTAIQPGPDPLNRYVVPGDPLHSIILQRAGATNGFTRMPPLATAEVDQEGIDLITAWIMGMPANRLYDDWAAEHAVIGSRTDDDDGDGRTNVEEFLLGGDPHSGADPVPLTLNGNGSLDFTRLPYRIYDIQKSTDLFNWSSWDIPQNTPGYLETTTPESIPIPFSPEPAAFYRLHVSEP